MQTSVLEYLERRVAEAPDEIAIIEEDAELSFAELRRRALRVAGAIEEVAAPASKPVGVYLPKSAEAIVAFLGALYAGAFYVPLDLKNPTARLRAIVRNLSPACVVTLRAHEESLVSAGVARESIVRVEEASAGGPGRPDEPQRALPAGRIDTDPVYVIYTSGSTGEPKGVVVPHRGVIDYIDWAKTCFDVGPDAIIGSQAPFHFDNSTLDIYLMLAAGAKLVLVPEEKYAFPARLLETLVEHGVNTIFWVPSVLIQVANMRLLEKTERPPLERILFAGEVMPVKHLNHWREHFPNALFSNLYGPTEITVDCTYFIVDRAFAESESLPIGFPCPNAEVIVLDEDRVVTGPGLTGELCVRGSCLALGYWNDPEKTAAAFVRNPLNDHYEEKIYRTGDLVKRNERGELLFVGRKDSQIKHLGYRIELGEVESAAQSLVEVENACVLYDEAQQTIVLFYQAPEEAAAAQLIRSLQALLPKYMIPRRYVHLASMPLNINGKIDRRSLREEHLAPG